MGLFKFGQHGFLVSSLLLILPFVIFLLIMTFQVFAFLQIRERIYSTCLATQIQTFSQVRKQILTLESLNPRALLLRTQHKVALIRLAAAIASQSPPAIAAAQAHLERIITQRKVLAERQQSIFKMAKWTFANESRQLVQKQNIQIQPLLSGLFSFFDFQPIMIKQLQQKLQLVPDHPDMAPAYVAPVLFTDKQKLEQSWQIHYEPAGFVRRFAQQNFTYNLTCASSLRKVGEKWEIIPLQ